MYAYMFCTYTLLICTYVYLYIYVYNHTSEKNVQLFCCFSLLLKICFGESMCTCRLISDILLCIVLHHDVHLGHFKSFKLEG